MIVLWILSLHVTCALILLYACAEIENNSHKHVTVSENSVDDSCVTSTRLECTTLVTKSTFLHNFVDEQLEQHFDIDSMLQAFAKIDVSVNSLSCTDCVDGVCSACAEINIAIADPPPIPNDVIHYIEEVDHNDDFTVYRLDDHEVDMDVTYGAFDDHGEVVEHDPMHQLTIVQRVEEVPPPKPPDFEIDFSNHDTLVFCDILRLDRMIRLIFTQIIVPQDFELPLSTRKPPDPH